MPAPSVPSAVIVVVPVTLRNLAFFVDKSVVEADAIVSDEASPSLASAMMALMALLTSDGAMPSATFTPPTEALLAAVADHSTKPANLRTPIKKPPEGGRWGVGTASHDGTSSAGVAY